MNAINRLLVAPIHFIMERKMLYGIRKRAEGLGTAAAGVDGSQLTGPDV